MRAGEVGFGQIQSDAHGIGVSLSETREVVARAATQVENTARSDADEVEPFIHAASDFTGEKIGAGFIALHASLPEPSA
jgi:hypothetical protein